MSALAMADESQKPKPRVAAPQRRQGVIRFDMPEDTLAATHTARVLWEVVGMLDPSAFLRGVKAVDGTVGRKTLSPRMKLTLWRYAISTGVGSAREIARLVRSDDAYRWIAGDLEVGHHALSAFRVDHGAALDELMTEILASLMHKGALSLDLVAQDPADDQATARRPRRRPADQRGRDAHEDDLTRRSTSRSTMASTSTATSTSTAAVKVKAQVDVNRRCACGKAPNPVFDTS